MELSGRYVIIKKIASGGMAAIYLAQDKILGRHVAVKLIHPHLLERADAKKRFLNEAYATASLEHENIIHIYDFGDTGTNQYIVMEFIDGSSLESIMETHQRLPNIFCIELARQVLQGLFHAHRSGVYHRDIKPANIMVTKSGGVKIMDFGIAFLVNQESLTMTGTFVGSPNYISPEQAQGKKVCGKTDIFSVGSVLYEAITGQCPFQADNPHAVIHRTIHEKPVHPGMISKPIIDSFAEFILFCLEKDQENRPDAETCIVHLEKILHDEHLSSSPEIITRALNTFDEYCASEKKILTLSYQRKAHEAFTRKKHVDCIRFLNEAAKFGNLPDDSEKLYRRIGRKNRSVRAAWICGILFFGVLIIVSVRIVGIHSVERINSGETIIPTRHLSARTDTGRVPVDTAIIDSSVRYHPPRSIDSPAVRRSTSTLPSPLSGNNVDSFSLFSNAQSTGNAPMLKKSKSHTGYLSIKTNPPWVSVSINGSLYGQTPQQNFFSLPEGRHFIRLYKEGVREFRDTVFIQGGDTLVKKIRMAVSKREE